MSSSVAPAAQRSPRKRLWYWASAWIPVVICILVIAGESTPYFGADRTTGPLQHFFEFLFQRHFTEPQWWAIHIMIRKCGHFLGYGILSAAWFRAFWMTWPATGHIARRIATSHALALLGTLLIAASDEYHQLFLPNRTGSFRDVMVDCSGAFLVQALIWIGMRIRGHHKS
jgi:VanZ family protein